MTETVGFIGLGAMDAGMARNLLKAGYAPTALASSTRKTLLIAEYRRSHREGTDGSGGGGGGCGEAVIVLLELAD